MIIIHDDHLIISANTSDQGKLFGITLLKDTYKEENYGFKIITKDLQEATTWFMLQRFARQSTFMKWKVGADVLIELTRHPIDYGNPLIGYKFCWNVYKMMPVEIEDWKWGTQVPGHIQEI